MIAQFVGIHAWDDGAITLAFSKTFAETGRSALTPVSEQVEGFSSISWLVLNTIPALFYLSFNQAIFFSQLLSAVFVTVSLCYISLFCKSLQLTPLVSFLTLLTFGLSGAVISETANGMEMTLLAATALAFVYSIYFEQRRTVAALAAIIFIATRFESIFYFAFLLVPLWLRGRRREAVLWAVFAGAIFLMLGLLRWIVFSDILPNTIWAKMHEPYSVHGARSVLRRIEAVLELPRALFPLLIFLAGLLVVRWRRLTSLAKEFFQQADRSDIFLMPIIGAEIFSLIAGKNWGYAGRMQFFALPFALLLVVQIFSWMKVFEGRKRALTVFLFAITIVFSWYNCARYTFSEMLFSISGASYFEAKTQKVTPATYRDVGLKVDRIRQLTGKETIVFMTPDIGGLGLCCQRIRVVDIALLANRTLARNGYASFSEVLAKENPNVIEVHDVWASKSGIYNDPKFIRDYKPLLTGNTRFFVRKDVFDEIKSVKVRP